MSFSLRSMFNKGTAQSVGALNAVQPVETISIPPAPNSMSPSASPTSAPPFGGPLFRTLGNDDASGEPLPFDLGQSPFSSPSGPDTVALTVADVLPQIPPEMARATSVPQDQPIQISAQILNHALSSGQLAVPLFEVYRVCPGIFQTPVSPEDPRMVRLPASKLPALISGAMPGATQPVTPSISPFSSLFAEAASEQTPPVSSFQNLFQSETPGSSPSPFNAESAPVSLGSTVLPPRRDPSQAPASSIPPSPFPELAATPLVLPTAGNPPSSPFEAVPESSSPFAVPSQTSEAPPSPFGAVQASPFASQPIPDSAPSPFAMPPPQEPTNTPAPASLLTSVPTNPPFPTPATGRITGAATASVAELVKGQTADSLGFNPAMVPSWITTQFNGGIVADLQEMPAPSIDLGTLIDGITDVGFRNVLSSARRDLNIAVPLTLLAPVSPTTANPVAASSPAAETITPKMVTPMRVGPSPESAEPASPSPFAASAEAAPSAAIPSESAPQPPQLGSIPSSLFASAPQPSLANPFSTPENTAPPAPSPFGMPQSFAPAPEPVPEPSASPVFKVEPGNPFSSVPDAPPPQDAFVSQSTAPIQPAPTPPQSLFAEAAAPTASPAPIQPKVDIGSLFGSSLAPKPAEPVIQSEMQAPPPPEAAPLPSSFSFGAKAFDPFAPTESDLPAQSGGGFSSFDLLGGTPVTPESIFKSEPSKDTPQAPPEVEPSAKAAQDELPPKPPVQPEQSVATPAKTPRFFVDTDFDGEPTTAIVPEIPVVLDAPIARSEPASSSDNKTPSWPDIDPIPEPELPSTPLFQDSLANEAAPKLDFNPPQKTPLSPAMPTFASPSRGIAPAKNSLGLSAVENSGEEQLLLRALLDTDEELTLDRVIDMTSALPGIAACALVRGSEIIAGSSTKSSDAKAFRTQAAEVAKSLRTLAPLIGISDAETFTLNTDSRLITLCFPGDVTLAILHDREPTLGLRDKLTLIARQLNSMVGKR